MGAIRSFLMLSAAKLGKLLWYIIMTAGLIFCFFRDMFLEALRSFKVDTIEIKLLTGEGEQRIRVRPILSLLSSIPLLMASVFVAKCSLSGKGSTACEAAVFVTGIILIKTLFRFLFGKSTSRYAELTTLKPFNILFWLFEGVQCVLFFCLWQELGLGALAVYFFGSVIHSSAIWIKGEMLTFEIDFKELLNTSRGEMTLGSILILGGAVLCTVRLAAEGISTLGIVAAAGCCLIGLIKDVMLILDRGFFRIHNSEPYNKKVPVSENGARLIRQQRSSIVRKVSVRDVAFAVIPCAAALAAWGCLSGFSVNLLPEGASAWNIALAVCILLTLFFPGGYCGSFRRIASFTVLIPAFVILWPSVGYVSIPGILIMETGKIIFQWDKYQTYGG